jgi:hypothetical protein
MPTAEFWVTVFEMEKMLCEKQRHMGPEYEENLRDCEKKLQEAKDWVASGKEGSPPFEPDCYANLGPMLPTPMNHEPRADGLECKRCGIEKIYWEHFPDCSMFKPPTAEEQS